MAPAPLPSIWISIGHDATPLRLLDVASPIGIVGAAQYPPDLTANGLPLARAPARTLDPHTYQLQLPAAAQKAPFRRLPYAQANVDPVAFVANRADRDNLIHTVASLSLSWGATHVIAPYFYAIDSADPNLGATLEIADATAQLLGATSIPALFVHQNALLPSHIDRLLVRLTSTDFDRLYLLVGVDVPSTAPISSDQVLSGLKLLVEVLGQNGIEVVLGATDTTGLLAATWSPSVRFALGPDSFLRRRRQPVAPSGGGFRPARARRFCKELIAELLESDYVRWPAATVGCGCRACVARGPEGRRSHYVNANADLAATVLASASPAVDLGRRVDTAMRLLGGPGSGPSDLDARRHLSHWRAHLP